MVSFAIIELEDGFAITTIQPGQTPTEAAAEEQGILVDAGPFATYEEACAAMCELEGEDEDTGE